MKDIQKTKPKHAIAIQRVGVTNIQLPIYLTEKVGGYQHTVGNVDVFVDLDADSKGTHMSRLAIGVQKFMKEPLNAQRLKDIAEYIRNKCDAKTSEVIYRFPYFINKLGPVSKEPGMTHCDVVFDMVSSEDGCDFTMSITTTATSCCPCSKEISEAGAHNQRSKIKITFQPHKDEFVWIEDIVDVANKCSSCEVFTTLKRPDEKYVTEEAYNNPKFVEDMVREAYAELEKFNELEWFEVTVSNEESIHQHNAFAKMYTE